MGKKEIVRCENLGDWVLGIQGVGSEVLAMQKIGICGQRRWCGQEEIG